VAPELVRASTPVEASYEAEMLPKVVELVLLNASTSSPGWKLPVIDTVAEASVALPLSETVTPGSTTAGVVVVLSTDVKLVLPPVVVTTAGLISE
jgi:hypothetical protein